MDCTISYYCKGDEEPGTEPADIVFVVEEKPHDYFKRDGDDLVYKHRCSLSDALTGQTIFLKTLDDRQLKIRVTDVVSPYFVQKVRGEGMPIRKKPGQKGDLKIEFDIKFPRELSDEKKSQLKQILPS